MIDYHRYLRYDDGVLIWKHRPNTHPSWNTKYAGKPAGFVNENGYLRIRINKVDLPASHVVWILHHGQMPEEELDHIDRDRLNNRIENLREVSRSDNMLNTHLRPGNKTGVKGVYWSDACKSYRATFRSKVIKQSRNLQECIDARRAAEQEHLSSKGGATASPTEGAD